MQLIDVFPFVPFAFGLLTLLVPRGNQWVRILPILGAVVTLGISVGFAAGYFLLGSTATTSSFHPWIAGPWTAAYHVRVDATSIWFVLLTTFVAVPAIWAAWSYGDAARQRGFMFLLLTFESTLLGLFTAADLLLFYIYWDLMLIPVFVLLAGYAGDPTARRAAWAYLIYNGAGGLVLLLGVVGLVVSTHTFEFVGSTPQLLGSTPALSPGLQWWLFGAFAIAFLVKTPAFPFHAWMPPTYTQSPPPLAAMISGIQSKAGLYGFIVFALPLFPQAAHAWAPFMLVIAVISILYGAFAALAQSDMKTLVAYTSLSHLGLVLLALFAFDVTSQQASIVMIVSHGLISAALFIMLGFIEERVRTRDLFAFGGLAAKAPRLQALMLIAAMAALGLPGLSGFAGEFLILVGSWQTQPVITAISLPAIVLASAYVLRLYQAAIHGEYRVPAGTPAAIELRPREMLIVAPLLAAIIFLGVWPGYVTTHTTPIGQPTSYESQ
ncbi:MAG TPA: NADH-quinone oxidoreductase subunit M [Candidatus Eremiobacteraceae bacterium]|nr:NADH-quinone oxidoreductase subunit M [Candidatus Eremiobacteraceae bacterium]